ncbi:Bax inhibitor-1 protein [Plakobranchus ocellatus]|uniref:Bax inhibitor-1 protein n=1 Tax=Plakobranchus ocellatus TaxID=259542 RepID=A0AAV4BR61_9GAST|nr:Bax inhibitor-1 protein [Plakobranchus ocellatus]
MNSFQPRSRESELFSPAIFKFDHLEAHVQTHLKNVYSCLSIGMLSAALGAYAHFYTGLGQWYFLTALGSLGLIAWLATTRHSKETTSKRLGIFTAFTFLSGISLGPLLDLVIRIEPSIISTALAGTAVVFISFTLAALLNRNRTFLYMGGFLMSGLMWLTLMGFLNIFFGSRMIFDFYIYGILALFSAFVLYDTQLIVEKRRRGDDDFIWQSVDLFLDAIQIFRALLIILAKKEDNKKRRRD